MVVTFGLRRIGYSNGLINLTILVGGNGGLVQDEHIVLIVERQGYLTLEVRTLQRERTILGIVLEA